MLFFAGVDSTGPKILGLVPKDSNRFSHWGLLIEDAVHCRAYEITTVTCSKKCQFIWIKVHANREYHKI